MQLEPDAGALVTLTGKLKSRVSQDPKIEWFEDELAPRFDVLNGALTAAATTMTVTNYAYFRLGDLVRVNKAEIVYVGATPTTTTVTIQRAFGETAAATASVGDQLQILSNTNLEGASTRAFLSTQRVAAFNYLQIIRHPFGYTNTALGTAQFGGKDEIEEQRKQLIEHKKDIEQAFLLGERYEDTTTGDHPVRATRGVTKFITTNVKDAGGDLTEPEFEDFLRIGYRYGSKEKVLFCSPKLTQVINGFGRGKLQTVPSDKTYGISLTEYIAGGGRRVLLHEHVLLTNNDLNDFTGIAGYGVLIDVADLEMRYLKGRMAILKTNIQANDADGRTDEYLSEVGLEMHQERKHALLTGVTG